MNGPEASDPKVLPLPLDPEVRDADLVAAAADLAAIAPEDELAPRPEWIEKVVAEATAGQPPVGVRHGLWRRLQRGVAAAAAVVGLHGTAGAMTVTAVGVVTVTASVLVWQAGHHSNETMSYAMAIDILRRGDQPEDHGASALFQVIGRIKPVVEALQVLRGDAGADPRLAAAADRALQRIRLLVDGSLSATMVECEDPFFGALATMLDGRQDAEARLAGLDRCLAATTTGLAAIDTIRADATVLAANRATLLRRLRKLLAQ